VISDEVYRQLHELAARFMGRERAGHTLQPTALLHEAIIRVWRHAPDEDLPRTELMSAAALAMRHVLVDGARRRRALKRGGAQERVPLHDTVALFEDNGIDLVDLDDALRRLALRDDQLARIVELRFFGGLTVEETAVVLEVSTRTVERGWRFARIWLYRALNDEEYADG
jgi:RNA polymerase sigma factor (TIGR02999 family)